MQIWVDLVPPFKKESIFKDKRRQNCVTDGKTYKVHNLFPLSINDNYTLSVAQAKKPDSSLIPLFLSLLHWIHQQIWSTWPKHIYNPITFHHLYCYYLGLSNQQLLSRTVVLNIWGWGGEVLLPRGNVAISKEICVEINGEVLSVSSGKWSEMLLNILQCTRQPLTSKNHLPRNINSATVEMFWLRIVQ